MTQFNPNTAMNAIMMSNHISSHFKAHSNNTLYETISDTAFISQTFGMFIQIFALSLFSALTNHLSDHMTFFKNLIDRFIRNFIFGIIINPFIKIYKEIYKSILRIKPKYKIEFIISLITSEAKRNNELLEIIQWFISSQYCIKKRKINTLNNTKEIYFPLNNQSSLLSYQGDFNKICFNISPVIDEDFLILFEDHEITCTREKTKIELNGDLESQKRDNISYYLRTYDEDENSEIFKRFCSHAVKIYNTTRKEWKQQIYSNSEDSWQRVTDIFSPNNVDSIILREGVKEDFVASLKFFTENKEFYKKNGQRHKYVTLLLGPPGTGKTTLVSAHANQNKRHIYSLNLNNSFEGNLKNLINTMNTEEGDLLIDDFDHYLSDLGKTNECTDNEDDASQNKFIKRKAKKMISYHELLTVLDGMESKEGLNIFICMNDPSKIFKSMNVEDLALIRERRVNKIIKFDYCDHKMIRGIYLNIFGREPNMKLIQMIKEDHYAPCVISQQFISFLETHGGDIKDKQKEIDKILLDLANNDIKTNKEKIIEYINTLKKYNL